jgi:acetyltransferase-like isoleucine patch superfamily enzyme
MWTFRLVVSVLISMLPLNLLRRFAYRYLFGYKIRGASIGFGTVIAVDDATLEECRIGALNLMIGPMKVIIKQGASIGFENRFICGFWVLRGEQAKIGYSRTLIVEEDALITSGHYFDVVGTFKLGQRSWIAGMGSQFWTHGAGLLDQGITIGSDCYLGSAVRFAPGSSIGNNVILSLGSVVVKPVIGDNLLVGGVPAKIIREDYSWKQDAT